MVEFIVHSKVCPGEGKEEEVMEESVGSRRRFVSRNVMENESEDSPSEKRIRSERDENVSLSCMASFMNLG